MKLIECVPNFSEGADLATIDRITDEILSVANVHLLDVDSGKDTNRTVVTFIGPPDDVITAAFKAIKMAATLINMKNHSGEHPRMGATDVCPLVPVSEVSMDECIEYSKKLAEKVGNELGIPVYLYEESSNTKYRKNLSDIRKGEYEGFKEKIKSSNWIPDYGKSIFNEKSGVTAIGARNFLIAYNINLNTRDKKIATDIALDIREAGRAKRDKNGKIIRKKDGSIVKIPGSLKYTKAVGWYIDEYKKAQVSINLTAYTVTSIELVFEEVRRHSNKRGVRVTGSEIIGLIPKNALLSAGLFYLAKQNKCAAIPEEDIIDVAIDSLGLNEITKFDQNTMIIENRIKNKNPLINLKISEFVNEVSINTPAPGGGSVSALVGSLAGSLISMVSNLTFGKKGYVNNNLIIQEIGIEAQKLKKDLLLKIDEDTEAFNGIMNAFRMPRKTIKDQDLRNHQIESATKHGIEVPLSIMELSYKTLLLSKKIIKLGNQNSLSDAGVSIELSVASINGAYMNVLINLKDIYDIKYIQRILKKAKAIIKKSEKEAISARGAVYKKLK